MSGAREEPRISVNGLAEYLKASPERRRSIVKEQKRPSDFKVSRYRTARQTLRDAVSNGDLSLIGDAIAELQAADADSDYEAKNHELNIEALTRFGELVADDLMEEIGDLNAESTNRGAPKLEYAGVRISVWPEITLRGDYRNDEVVGGVFFHFSKSRELGDDVGKYIGTLIEEYLEMNELEDADKVSRRHSIVVDIPRGEFFTAPRYKTKRRRDIAAACEEIALRWQMV